jgi:hypothetical protein
MSYDSLLNSHVIREHRFNRREAQVRVEEMLLLSDRDLEYAQAGGLPLDLHYLCAYSVTRVAAELVMLSEGFRPDSAMGKHAAVFRFLGEVDAGRWAVEARFFDKARQIRNELEYERPNVATQAEVDELTGRAAAFLADVRHWLRLRHPELLQPPSSEPS